jgi:hypothetical protein
MVVIALTRIVCPEDNIPSTTALATINVEQGRELGLMRGANVVMPNLTPLQYRAKYEIYPSKACVKETAEDCHICLNRRIEAIGRKIGRDRGDRIHRVEPVEREINSFLLDVSSQLCQPGMINISLLGRVLQGGAF